MKKTTHIIVFLAAFSLPALAATGPDQKDTRIRATHVAVHAETAEMEGEARLSRGPVLKPFESDGENARRHELFFSYDAMTWTETDAGGAQILEEEGFTVGLHLRSRWRNGRRPDIRTEVRGFTGTLDYDGETFAGAPLQSTTEYFGLGAAADTGAVLPLGKRVNARVFAGLATVGRIRRIDGTGRISGEGYDEYWFTFDATAGVTLSLDRPAGFAWFVEPGIAYPLYQRVEYDLTFPDGTSDVSVEPGKAPGFSVEAGVRTPRTLVSVRYETRDFDRSDVVQLSLLSISQPDSRKEAFTVRFGIRF